MEVSPFLAGAGVIGLVAAWALGLLLLLVIPVLAIDTLYRFNLQGALTGIVPVDPPVPVAEPSRAIPQLQTAGGSLVLILPLCLLCMVGAPALTVAPTCN